MVANLDKFQAIFLGTKKDSIVIKVGSSSIESSKCVKPLGITIDNQLTFYPHTGDLQESLLLFFLHRLCPHLAIVPWCGCFAINGHTILFAKHIIKHYVPDSILLLKH